MAFTTSAFVSAAAPLTSSSFTARRSLCARPATSYSAARAVPRAVLGLDKKKAEPAPESKVTGRFNKIEQDRRARLDAVDTDPQGFTDYAEKVNGRLAMMFFVIGFLTEIASGKTMADQILILGSPLTAGLQAIAQTFS